MRIVSRDKEEEKIIEENPIAEIPETITVRVEGHPEMSFRLTMRTYRTGTRGWEFFGVINIKNEPCTVQSRFYVQHSKNKESPWWWRSRKSMAEREAERKLNSNEGDAQQEEQN